MCVRAKGDFSAKYSLFTGRNIMPFYENKYWKNSVFISDDSAFNFQLNHFSAKFFIAKVVMDQRDSDF